MTTRHKQAIILADALVTVLIKIDMYWGKDGFPEDLFSELEEYLDNSELHDIYSAVESYINEHGLDARAKRAGLR